MTAREWAINRLCEVSTYAGAFLVASGNWGLSASSPTAQQVLDVYNHVAPQVGAALVAMSTRHP